MGLPQNAVLEVLSRFAGRLRFPQLFALVAALFFLDLLIPDLIPFLDEILLGLATLLLGSWKRDRGVAKQQRSSAPGPESPDEKHTVIDVEAEK